VLVLPARAAALLPVAGRVTVTAARGVAAPRAVALQHWTGRRWAAAGAARATGTRGRYTVRTTPPARGLQRYRVIVTGRGGTVVSRTAPLRAVASYSPVASGPLTRRAVPYSYRPGCPVPPATLRKLTFTYWTMKGTLARGTVVVRLSAVRPLRQVFRRAFDTRFPLQKVVPVDAYYRHGKATPTQSDIAQMADGDTMAFNCRSVTGNPYRLSRHSYGDAIDINCRQNPYVTGRHVYPAGSRAYLVRRPYRKGMILPGGPVATAMRRQGWRWGARWAAPDYQHFSRTGG
jgi:hypothetical protein